MAAKRCSDCGINHPMTATKCAFCGNPVWYMNDGYPDPDFEARLAAHKAETEPPKPIEVIPGIAKERIAKQDGQPWIHDESLTACGYEDPHVGMVIRVQGRTKDIYFELAGRARRNVRTWGKNEALPGWWLIRIDPEGWVPDAPPPSLTNS